MPSPEQIHEDMAEGYARQRPEHWKPQAEIDAERRSRHFQVRLPAELAAQLRHYMASRDLNANQALHIIISRFFNSTHG